MAKIRQTGEFEIEDVYQKSENIQLGWTNIWDFGFLKLRLFF